MRTMRKLWIIALVALAVAPMTGCASSGKGKVRLSLQKMCESTGGTYKNYTCNPGTSSERKAKQICESNGGVYDPDADACQYEGM